MGKHKELEEQCLSSEMLIDGVLLKAYRDTVLLPDGSRSVREWIDHPGASAVVPLFDDGSTILVRQFRYPARREFLEVPAGKIDVDGESPRDVAGRELEEETGWLSGRITRLGSLYPCIGYSSEIIHFYLAEDLSPGRRSLSEGEHLECVRMRLEEAMRLAVDGKLLDMKTLAALTMARSFLALRESAAEN